MICKFHMFAFVALTVFVGSCASRAPFAESQASEERPVETRLNSAEAIKIAKRAAQRFGVNLSEHPEPTATYRRSEVKVVWPLIAEGPGEPAFGEHIWVVHFGWGPKMNYPGGDFMVYVDDKTGRSRLVGGM